MTNDKLVTVSIAAYNVEQYLRRTLDSCLVDNMAVLDVIVVNDGSSDATSSIAHEYAREYPDVFRVIDKPNGGYGSTINVAIREARGTYFRYLDGDDWFDTQALDEYLQDLKGVDADVVYTPYCEIRAPKDERVEFDVLADVLSDEVVTLGSIHPSKALSGCSLAYKTELLIDSDFHETEGVFYADTEYAFKPMAHAKTIRVMHHMVYCYRVGHAEQTMSLSNRIAHVDDLLVVIDSIVDDFCKLEEQTAPSDAVLDYYYKFLSARIGFAFKTLCLAGPSAEVKHKAQRFDEGLRRAPGLYEQTTKRVRRVQLLRKSRFLLFGVLSRRYRRRYASHSAV